MADKKQRAEVRFITPKGIAIYPKLNKADTKFKAEGEYTVKLRLAPDALPAARVKQIEELLEKFAEEKRAELKPAVAKKLKVLSLSEQGLKPEENDKGEETGNIILKAGMKARGTSKKDGKPWTRSPIIFDAKGKKLDPAPQIWGGSELKVAVIAAPYYMAKDNACGITFYLEAVQIIKLVSGSDKDAAGYGFGEEDGYEDEEAAQAAEFAESEGSDAKSGDEF